MNNIEKNPDRYSDINSYVPPTNSNQSTISNDVPRSHVPGIDSAMFETCKPIIDKVLHYTHGKSTRTYYQGYNCVCMGITFMIKQCYPNLDDINTIKLCTSIYFDVLHTLNLYSSLLKVYGNNQEVPEFFKNEYKNLVKSFEKDKVHVALDSVICQVCCAFGTLESQNKEFYYSSVKGRLIKDLLLYCCGKITKENLESEMAYVMYKQCKELLNSLPAD